ncbi:MAG: hypothetical protein BM563_06120 [Bacteroidetes bacterium MedPE-SWsnd-G1]|nr:MAG: hypothetical protein BM563_06120 [Bacteroidetes bacterium MedPE-SWsnd-G1]
MTKKLLLFCLSIVCSIHLFSQEDFTEKNEIITDLAINDTIEKKSKMLPFLIPITEPAIGYGAIIGGLLFVPKDDPEIQSDMIVLAGGATTNSTWFTGGGYFGFWKDDTVRYVGYAGGGKVTMKFYGLSDLGYGNPFYFDQRIFLLTQQLEFRLGESNFFLGGKYQLSRVSVPHNVQTNLFFDLKDYKITNSGVSFIAEYDNLNDFLSPTNGAKVYFSYDQNLEFLGSQRDWGMVTFYSHLYHRASDLWVPSLRLDSKFATGNPPFYAFPYVELRGVPALRYQGRITMVAETEHLINLTKKWGVVGFTGIGAAFKSFEEFHNDEVIWNLGFGVRYRPIESMPVRLGADFAKGPEDFAFYISIGSAW